MEEPYIEGLDDMDDLFIEADSVLPTTSTMSKQVLQRLDELSVNGCCQKIGWSNFGCVAAIQPDGQSICVQAYVWDLLESANVLTGRRSLVSKQIADSPIVHLSWNKLGLDLAVVDATGSITFYNTVITLNRLIPASSIVPDQVDSLSAIVGMEWLPMSRATTTYHCVVKPDDTWTYHNSQQNSIGPFHPLPTRSSLVAVSRNGFVRLFYTQANNRWSESQTRLGTMVTTESLLTHAACAPENDKSLLIVTHDFSNTLELYRLKIDWRQKLPIKIPPPPDLVLKPTIEIERLKVDHRLRLNETNLPKTQRSQLTHLRFLPEAKDTLNNQSARATVLAIFSIMSIVSEASLSTNTYSTRIIRLEVREEVIQLHSSFEQLGHKKSKGASNSPKQATKLHKLADLDIVGSVIEVSFLKQDTQVAFLLSDGSVDIRDRFTWEPCVSKIGSRTLADITDSGFAFLPTQESLHASLSPHHCAIVTMAQNEEIRLTYMQRIEEKIDHSNSKDAELAFKVTSAMYFATSIHHHINNDDILGLLYRNIAPDVAQFFIVEIFNAVALSYDFMAPSLDGEKLLRGPIVPRCLSAQLVLGQKGPRRNIPAKLGFTSMSLRFTALALQICMNMARQGHGVGMDADLARSLFGLVDHFNKLIALIFDDLMTLSRNINDANASMETIQEALDASKSPALLLVLCNMPRTLLRLHCRLIRTLEFTARDLSSASRPGLVLDPHTRQAWHELSSIVTSSPIDSEAFETLTMEVDHYAKEEYKAAPHADPAEKAMYERNVETKMLISGQIPEILLPVVRRTLTSTLRKLQENEAKVDLTKVHSMDVRLLGISDDPQSIAFRKRHKIDVLRKFPLVGIRMVRRCTRCCAYMEDVPPRNVPHWILTLQKSCVCGNPWVLLPIEEA